MSDRSLFNAFIYLEPVQRSEDGCDMGRFRSFNHSTCKTVLNLVETERGEWPRIPVEQDSKAKALTAAQKLKNYKKLYNKQKLK